jgi:hypothetical protein
MATAMCFETVPKMPEVQERDERSISGPKQWGCIMLTAKKWQSSSHFEESVPYTNEGGWWDWTYSPGSMSSGGTATSIASIARPGLHGTDHPHHHMSLSAWANWSITRKKKASRNGTAGSTVAPTYLGTST